jgi:hypothetical protein
MDEGKEEAKAKAKRNCFGFNANSRLCEHGKRAQVAR